MYSITGHKRTGPCNYLLWLARLLLAHYLYCPTRTHSRFASPNSKPKNRDANTIFPVSAQSAATRSFASRSATSEISAFMTGFDRAVTVDLGAAGGCGEHAGMAAAGRLDG